MFCYDMKSLAERITFQPKNISYRNLKFKFVNFKAHFAKLRRKITGYADMLMMRINLPIHGLIQKFTKEALFCNCY